MTVLLVFLALNLLVGGVLVWAPLAEHERRRMQQVMGLLVVLSLLHGATMLGWFAQCWTAEEYQRCYQYK